MSLPQSQAQPPGNEHADAPSPIRRVAGASLLGSVVEWYDFFLYGTMAALVFNNQFFPSFDPLVGTMIAFATFAAGFVTRPLGGFIFGHFGDRVGRKKMLVITMLIMGLSTFAMGLLPNYAAIGVAAPLLLLALRMLQGIGLGGEWGGAVLLCVEHAPDDKRGWFSSWPQLGVPIGLLTSTLAVTAVTRLPEDDFQSWGWRIPFLVSIVLVVVGLVIRLRIEEPPAFKDLEEADDKAALPLVEVFRKHPKVTFLAMGARVSESVTFNIYNAFLVTYTVTVLGLDKSIVLDALLVASVVGFFTILAAGRLSDRYGRRPVFGAGAALALVSAVPIFALVNTENAALITLGIVIGWGLAACIMFGPEGAMFAEVFPTRVRYSGMSAVYQIGVIPTGAVAPLIGTSLVSAWSGSVWPVAVYVMAMALISLVSVFFLPETHRRNLRDVAAPTAGRRSTDLTSTAKDA
ncbi:MFS transporter [Mycobacterium cookii]|uniref:MFS transporter n=1 Tax=Nocardioides furvisabuli TaxID=375542 RepID=A0ABP5J9S2_9ACTN|nr:MFS transporter [Nocardioides furvisabuli]